MLSRLWRYCDKIFKLTNHLAQLKNKGFTKKNNEPFITAILFMAMFMRLKSFNALEDTMKRNKKVWKKILNTDYLPSIDTIPRRLRNSDIKGLANMAQKFNHKLRRNKALNTSQASNGLMVAAIDGHETFSSRKRCCSKCKRRRVKVKGKWIYEYFHSYVVCQLILVSVPVFMDMEPIKPREGELTAAKRLIKRILKEQSRMVDVFTFDALYLDSKLLNLLDKEKKYWIAVLKNENRDAYKEVDGLLDQTKAIKTKIGKRSVTLYDMHELAGWDKLDKTFRAVVSDERWYQWEMNPKREKEKVLKTSHWRWLTNMPPTYHPEIVHRFGHGRWNEEERGFNDLATNCHFDHPYHHHPIALLAMLWIIAITFNLSYAFYQKNLKPEIRKEEIRSRSQLAVTIIETFNSLDEAIFSISPLLAQLQPQPQPP
jgi:hypothetical protein